jgi:glycosyltransferase involved in cell wall biosynthesis
VTRLSALIITLNEAAHITAAVQSVAWADEVLVVDSHSTDDTVELAKRAGARVEVRDWPGYISQKNYAASIARNDWVLSLDADERVTPELAAEIKALLATNPLCAGYRIPRVSYYLGRWIRSTDWYPDPQLRLYDRRRGQWRGRYVHESVNVEGAAGMLRHDLQHYTYRDVSHHLKTIDRYTSLAARQMHEDGRRSGIPQVLLHPPAAFLRNYIARGGFRDGSVGLIVSLLNSYYVFCKFVKLWELQHRGGADSQTPPELPANNEPRDPKRNP